MPYCDDFWYIDAHENILSPAYLTVFVKSKTENQLIRFVIAYLVADNNVKCEAVAATRDRRLRRPGSSRHFGQFAINFQTDSLTRCFWRAVTIQGGPS